MPESEEERRKRMGLTAAAQPTATATAQPTTPGSPMPNQPAVGANLRLPQEQQRTGPQPERIKSAAEIQSSLPNLTVGQQTRGAGGVRLDQQTAPAGKELIGMKSGVPIYADAKDVYGVNTAAPVPVLPTQTGAAAAAAAAPSMLQRPVSQQTTTPSAQPMVFTREATDAEQNQRLQQARDAYQTGATASAVRAQAAPAPEQKKFGTATREDFDRAQVEARQRAMERLAYPRQDRPTSTTETTNAAAAALRRAAAEPKVASMEEVQRTGTALGYSPSKIKQLGFGVGDQGESLAVTPDYLKRLRQRAGLNY